MKWVAGYTAALCALALIITTSIIIPTFFMPFFSWQYEIERPPSGLNAMERIGIEKDELMRVTTELLDFMRGRRESLTDIYAQLGDGPPQPFFTDPTELRHMYDVLVLYDIAFLVRNISFFLLIFLILGLGLLKARVLEVLARCCREVLTGFLLLLGALVGLIALDFDRAFVIFHLIFFDNDYWILDFRHSRLLNMVPQGFFVDISIFVGLLLLLFCLTIIVAGTLYLRHLRKTGAAESTRIVAKFGR